MAKKKTREDAKELILDTLRQQAEDKHRHMHLDRVYDAQLRTTTALERIAKSLEGGDGRILALIEREAASINQIDTTLVRIASLLATLADQTKPMRMRQKREKTGGSETPDGTEVSEN